MKFFQNTEWEFMKPLNFIISILLVGDGTLSSAEHFDWIGRIFYQPTSSWNFQQLKMMEEIFQELVQNLLKVNLKFLNDLKNITIWIKEK